MKLLLPLTLTTLVMSSCAIPNNFLTRASSCKGKLSGEQVYKRTAESIAIIRAAKMTGSGFIIDGPDDNWTYLLTNSHVVNKRDIVKVSFIDKTSYEGEVIGDLAGSANKDDLALIRIQKVDKRALSIDNSQPQVGAEITAIGTPKGLQFSITKGVISQIRDDGNILQVDAAINEGNSGGPILNQAGCVVGVSTFILKESEGLNFAVSAKPLKALVASPKINVNRWKTLSHGSYLPEEERAKSSEAHEAYIRFYELPASNDKFDYHVKSSVEIIPFIALGGKPRNSQLFINCDNNFVLRVYEWDGRIAEDKFDSYQVILTDTEEWGQPYDLTITFHCPPGSICLTEKARKEFAEKENEVRQVQLALNYYCKAGLNRNVVRWYSRKIRFKNTATSAN